MAMTKLTLKLMSLFILTFFSTISLANSPWAEEEKAAEPVQNEPVSAAQPVDENSRPAMEEEVIEPVSVQQDEPETAAETTVQTETIEQGDVLETPQVASVRVLDFPRRGMTTDKVENELGRPIEIVPAIGQPPISRWIYNDRTVYFEYSSVIHVVAK